MKRWMSYAKPYTLYFILGPLLMIVEVIGEVLMPMFLGQILNEASDGTLTTMRCIMYIGLMLLTAIMMMAGGVGGAYYGTKASVNYAADLRRDVYKKVQKFSFANIDKFSTGSLVTRLTNDITQVQNFVNTLLRMCMRSPGMFIGALIMAIQLRPQLSWVFAIAIPVIAIVITLIIKTAFPPKERFEGKHPARRSFQAIRIEVNRELDVIPTTLSQLVEHLKPGGRLCVITFHSLEDRVVKECYKGYMEGCTCPRDFPVCVCGKKPTVKVVSKKPILPSAEELEVNPRSRSAKLRVAEKI